jgi:ferric-dicitrate binding protein FerR (iron transport regulator)
MTLLAAGVPVVCPTCGSQVTRATADDQPGRWASWNYLCDANPGHAWQLDTLITHHADRIKRPTRPNTRTHGTKASTHAASLPRTGRRAQVAAALTALGEATALEIAEWINTQDGMKPTESAHVARRALELVDSGWVTETGTRSTQHDAKTYALTNQEGRAAA